MINLARSLLGATILLAVPGLALAQDAVPQQVLFVGNSYFYYNDSLHNHTVRMAEEGQGTDEFDFRSITISGGSLDHHPIAHYLTPGAVGYDEPFDVVVLAGNSSAANSDERRARFTEAAIAADALIDETGAQTALYMTHAYGEGHDDYDPEMIDNLVALYTDVAEQTDALVIPVGLAFAKAYEERPEVMLHADFDHSHPSLEGSYLAAATVYATLYDASPVGLEYDYFGRIDAETAAFLQQVAADTIAEFAGE